MPGTGRTFAEFLALGIWVALLLYVARLVFDVLAFYVPNTFTAALVSIVGGGPVSLPAYITQRPAA